jgi:aminoglycoside phosphotransferase
MPNIEYLIVQASGKGTRMGHLTKNKPKALIPIQGKPILYHLNDSFPNAKLYIVGDYKFEILEKYFLVNKPQFKYEIIRSRGEGSCQGLQIAREKIQNEGGNHFALTWCDLIYTEPVIIPKKENNYIGITNSFPCRWSYNDSIEEKRSNENGILGFFYFGNLNELPRIPENGEFVRFLKESNIKLEKLRVDKVIEIGTLDAYEKITQNRMNVRFFNEIKQEGDKLIKTVKDPAFKGLMENEIGWYKYMADKNYPNIPKIYSYSPLTMEKINGWQLYDYDKIKPKITKEELIEKIILALKELHSIEERPYDENEAKDVYIKKTIERINKVKPIIPLNETEYYYVNKKKVRNLYHPKFIDDIKKLYEKLSLPSKYTVIHGDPTFSNILIENKTNRVIFIDPRGYFATTKIYGDPYYDFAKLYYSAIGDYDKFNQRKFKLNIEDNSVSLEIDSNNFRETEEIFYKYFSEKEMKNLKILHVFIWLSLAGYILDDVDSMMGAYFKGLELFEEAIKNEQN